jgi:hypothetical protein
MPIDRQLHDVGVDHRTGLLHHPAILFNQLQNASLKRIYLNLPTITATMRSTSTVMIAIVISRFVAILKSIVSAAPC